MATRDANATSCSAFTRWGGNARRVGSALGSATATSPFVPSLPDGILVPVDQLPDAHPASAYLRQRNFDPAALWETWWVQFCELSVGAQPNPSQPLGYPDLRSPTSVWQAGRPAMLAIALTRCPSTCRCKGMKKSQLLYGLAEARSTQRPRGHRGGPDRRVAAWSWCCGAFRQGHVAPPAGVA